MITRRNPCLALLALFAAGCASSPSDKVSRNVAAAPSGGGELVIGALADSALPPGECGMVLWTLEADQPTPIFRMTAGKGADVMVNGKLRTLAVAEALGASGYGVSEEQRFVAEGFKANVKVRFGLGFEGGNYLERGLLSVEADNGWRSVIPAAGIAGCRPK